MSKNDLLGINKIGNMSDLTNPEVQKGLNTINNISSNPDRIWKGTYKTIEVYEYIKDGIGVIRDRATGEVITVLSRTTPEELQKLQDFVENGTAEWLK